MHTNSQIVRKHTPGLYFRATSLLWAAVLGCAFLAPEAMATNTDSKAFLATMCKRLNPSASHQTYYNYKMGSICNTSYDHDLKLVCPIVRDNTKKKIDWVYISGNNGGFPGKSDFAYRLRGNRFWDYRNGKNNSSTISSDMGPVKYLEGSILGNHVREILTLSWEIPYAHSFSTVAYAYTLSVSIPKRLPNRPASCLNGYAMQE